MCKIKFFAIFATVVSAFAFASCNDDDKDTSKANTYQDNKEKGEQYLLSNRSEEGVKETSTGLQYKIITYDSKAQRPEPWDTLVMEIKANARGGETFADSTYTIILSQQIEGLKEGVRLMTVGSEFEFFIPYYLGFGNESKTMYFKYNTITISPYSALYYRIKLKQIGGTK